MRLTRKNDKGIVTIYPIIGIVLVGVIGIVVALKVLPQKSTRKVTPVLTRPKIRDF